MIYRQDMYLLKEDSPKYSQSRNEIEASFPSISINQFCVFDYVQMLSQAPSHGVLQQRYVRVCVVNATMLISDVHDSSLENQVLSAHWCT